MFRFAWSELRNDADFEQFAESFDRNDVDNIDMAERYLRHYLRHHPAPKGQKGTHYLISLKQVFTNQEVIDAFADDYIDGYLKQAPEDMEAVLDVYKKISTNTKAHVSAEAVYAHYKNLRKGADALDFEMTDEKSAVCPISAGKPCISTYGLRGAARVVRKFPTWKNWQPIMPKIKRLFCSVSLWTKTKPNGSRSWQPTNRNGNNSFVRMRSSPV